MRRSALVFACLFVSCSGPSTSTDMGAGADAFDAGRDATAAPDLGPRCALTCAEGLACCFGADGTPGCRDLSRDPLHCGACGIACAEGRGTECVLGACVCGGNEQGCLGDRRSWCCPPRSEGGGAYCAGFDLDAENCGGCNMRCDARQADRCDGASCVCGARGRRCSGAAADTCCASELRGDIACVDTTTDVLHCGACGNVCNVGERCLDGSCSVGVTACSERCAPGSVCCGGVCCDRVSCGRGLCGRDGGAIDAGAPVDASEDARDASSG